MIIKKSNSWGLRKSRGGRLLTLENTSLRGGWILRGWGFSSGKKKKCKLSNKSSNTLEQERPKKERTGKNNRGKKDL